MAIILNSALRQEYTSLFASCIINEAKRIDVENCIKYIMDNKARYDAISNALKIPWYVVAVIHMMESSGKFTCHLHNGDPLTSRTRQVPKDRPVKGNPPFTWEESALDALTFDGLARWKDWTVSGTLFKLEIYNGLGYRRHKINSPYLWSYSNHYKAGKYVRDGEWSDTAISKQIGAAVILRRMKEKGLISFPEETTETNNISKHPIISYDPINKTQEAEDLQKFLNTKGAILQVDGRAGDKTSEAFHKLFGYYLKGDPRN